MRQELSFILFNPSYIQPSFFFNFNIGLPMQTIIGFAIKPLFCLSCIMLYHKTLLVITMAALHSCRVLASFLRYVVVICWFQFDSGYAENWMRSVSFNQDGTRPWIFSFLECFSETKIPTIFSSFQMLRSCRIDIYFGHNGWMDTS